MPQSRKQADCTLLVVDGQASVRELCTAILSRRGYEVLAAEDIDSAIRLCARLHWPEIKLILLDALLPGPECVRLLRILRLGGEKMPLLFLSRVSAAELAGQFGVAADHPVLQKPFTILELLQAVRGVLHDLPPGREIAS